MAEVKRFRALTGGQAGERRADQEDVVKLAEGLRDKPIERLQSSLIEIKAQLETIRKALRTTAITHDALTLAMLDKNVG